MIDLTKSKSEVSQWETVIPSFNKADSLVKVDNAKKEMLSRDDFTKFGLIFVDEGHHVFGYESELHLQGQHILQDCSQVRELIEDLLYQGESGQYHGMVAVFHDSSQSSMSNKKIPYPFEGRRIESKAMNSSIRMPKSVADQSVPFGSGFQSDNQGFMSPFPMNKNAVAGKVVEYQDVYYNFGSMFKQEYFAEAVTAVLVKLKDQNMLGNCDKNNLRLAVIFPRVTDLTGYNTSHLKSPKYVWTHDAIEEIGRRCVELSNIEDVFPGVDVRSHNIVWTWAANMAGLEADIVIMVGGRIGASTFSWDHDRVSSDMFITVSRCTFKLFIVAPRASKLSAHVKLSEKGEVKYSSGDFETWAVNHTYVCVSAEGSEIYKDLKIDEHFTADQIHLLSVIPSMEIALTSFGSVINRYLFQWSKCNKAMYELSIDLTNCTDTFERMNDIFKNIRDHTIKLKVLKFSNASVLTQIPRTLSQVESLERVLIENCIESVELPADIEISSLLYLSWKKCNKVILPQNWSKVREVSLLDNREVVLEHIGTLQSLEILRAQGNRLTNIPECLSRLSNLENLQLDGNKLRCIPEGIGKLSSLEVLNLFGNEISDIEEGLFVRLTNLRWLNLNGNKLAALPRSISCLENLESLILFNNPIEKIEEGVFKKLIKVKNMNLSRNKLTALPEDICHLNSIIKLFLERTHISTIPPTFFANLSNLEVLNLSENGLLQPPLDGLSNLTSLKQLTVDRRMSSCLPSDLADRCEVILV